MAINSSVDAFDRISTGKARYSDFQTLLETNEKEEPKYTISVSWVGNRTVSFPSIQKKIDYEDLKIAFDSIRDPSLYSFTERKIAYLCTSPLMDHLVKDALESMNKCSKIFRAMLHLYSLFLKFTLIACDNSSIKNKHICSPISFAKYHFDYFGEYAYEYFNLSELAFLLNCDPNDETNIQKKIDTFSFSMRTTNVDYPPFDENCHQSNMVRNRPNPWDSSYPNNANMCVFFSFDMPLDNLFQTSSQVSKKESDILPNS
jgi:hypothetical protein